MQNTLSSRTIADALATLKQRLQHVYEEAYPDLSEIIHLVLNEEESKARELSGFPHLLLPDLVEAHIARLGLHPVGLHVEDLLVPTPSTQLTLAAA